MNTNVVFDSKQALPIGMKLSLKGQANMAISPRVMSELCVISRLQTAQNTLHTLSCVRKLVYVTTGPAVHSSCATLNPDSPDVQILSSYLCLGLPSGLP
jgi:hypothetical protein